jgi:hypothetical protein
MLMMRVDDSEKNGVIILTFQVFWVVLAKAWTSLYMDGIAIFDLPT